MRRVFFFNDPPPTEIYTLSLHDALPISMAAFLEASGAPTATKAGRAPLAALRAQLHALADAFAAPTGRSVAAMVAAADRKSTRLNSSHLGISYAVFCLKKKKSKDTNNEM